MPSFLVMKGMALKGRLKEKDTWDIYYCVRFYQGGIDKLIEEFRPMGIDKLIEEFRPMLEHGLVIEALGNIAEKFASPTAVGPTHVADFYEIADASERELIRRDAYERITNLLAGLGIG